MPGQGDGLPPAVVTLRDPSIAAAGVAFGTGSAVLLEVTDPQSAADGRVAIVTSPSDPVGETVTLRRDAIDGVFRAVVGFEAAPQAGDGEVAVADGDQVTASYAEDSGALRQGKLTWRQAARANLTVDGSAAWGSGARVHILVADADLDLDPEAADRARAEVRTADGQRRWVCLAETGLSSGIFAANHTPFADRRPAGGACKGAVELAFRSDGGPLALTVAYEDLHSPLGGISTATAAATTKPSADARVGFLRDDGLTPLGPGGTFRGGESAVVRVEDPEAAGAPSVSVEVFSTSDPAGLRVDATAVGDGEFVATVGLGDATLGGSLGVLNGDLVVARYTDAHDARGRRVDVVAQAAWNELPRLMVRPLDGILAGTAVAAGTVELDDGLRDATPARDTVAVRIVSDRDPVGVTVSLLETGAETGRFTGTFGTNGAASNPLKGVVWAKPGDSVRALLPDEHTPVTSEPALVAGSPATEPRPAGTVSFFSDTAYQHKATSLDGLLRVPVEVREAALGHDPAAVERITVRVGSGLEPVASVTASSAPTLTGGETFTLQETGPNTGVFRDLVVLTCAPPPSPTAVSVDCFGRLAPNTVTVQTLVATEGATGILLGELDWSPADQPEPGSGLGAVDGPLSLDPLAHLGGRRTLDLVVLDDDAAADDGPQPDMVRVRVRSTSDPTGVLVDAVERFGHHGTALHPDAFRAQVRLCRAVAVCLPGEVLVGESDEVTLAYNDAMGSDGLPHEVTATLPWGETHTTAFTIEPEVRGLQGVALRLADPDLDTGQLDTGNLTVVVSSASDPVGIPIVLNETGAAIGTFLGRIGFTHGPSNATAGALRVADGDEVQVAFLDPADADGRERLVTTTFRWLEHGSAWLSFAEASHDGATPVTLTLGDPDRDTTGEPDEVQVLAWTGNDGDGAVLTLKETGAHTGVFSGVVPVGVAASDPLRIARGDTLFAYYRDDLDAAGARADRLAHAAWTGPGNVDAEPQVPDPESPPGEQDTPPAGDPPAKDSEPEADPEGGGSGRSWLPFAAAAGTAVLAIAVGGGWLLWRRKTTP